LRTSSTTASSTPITTAAISARNDHTKSDAPPGSRAALSVVWNDVTGSVKRRPQPSSCAFDQRSQSPVIACR